MGELLSCDTASMMQSEALLQQQREQPRSGGVSLGNRDLRCQHGEPSVNLVEIECQLVLLPTLDLERFFTD